MQRKSLILTARHVIETSPDEDIWFYFRHEGTMKRAPVAELANRLDVAYKAKVRIKIVSRCYSQKPDLAVLEVERSIDHEHRVRFFELAEDSATPPSETVITMRGYPSGQSRVVAPGSVAAFAMLRARTLTLRWRRLPLRCLARNIL